MSYYLLLVIVLNGDASYQTIEYSNEYSCDVARKTMQHTFDKLNSLDSDIRILSNECVRQEYVDAHPSVLRFVK